MGPGVGDFVQLQEELSVNRSKTAFAKLLLVFFAVLFTAVLIHPDVDLLDVHDVKITSVRSHIRNTDASFVRHVPFLLGCNQSIPGFRVFLSLALADTSPADPSSSSVLRL